LYGLSKQVKAIVHPKLKTEEKNEFSTISVTKQLMGPHWLP